MATLDLKQIIDKLNSEFVGDTRKLVFWFDEKAEFNEDIEGVVLNNAKVYRLEKDNFFFTKYFLEKEDTTTNYLIYAPFAKPDIRENHLADTIRYSKEFFADRASLLAIDLGIQEKYKPLLQKYMRFFVGARDVKAARTRTEKFYELELENYTQDSIETGMMCVLCKLKTVSFDEVVRVVLTEGTLEDNKFLAEFEKHDLMPAFWRLCEGTYGYGEAMPTLEKFVMTLFVTYIAKYVDTEVPKGWSAYVSYKSGNIKHFLSNLMNSMLYGVHYDTLADQMCETLQAEKYLAQMGVEAVVECDAFKVIDRMIIKWIKERLLSEDTGATLGGIKIPDLCEDRLKKHYGTYFKEAYKLLKSAYELIAGLPYFPQSTLNEVIDYYRSTGCLLDTAYRSFYRAFDRLEEPRFFEDLRELMENIYTNAYLEKITVAWNKALQEDNGEVNIPLQTNFYKKYVENNKERTVVIISDALRYEVGRELFTKLENDEKCTAKIEGMMGVLPSYTKLGMAALLPHGQIEMKEVNKVLVDGKPTDSTEQRQAILQSYVPNSKCVRFKDVVNMGEEDLRAVFQEQSVVYVYHNQIDARGDEQITEHEVFNACEEAIEEIYRFIKRLTQRVSVIHYVVTADHGFIYKRDVLTESDKIEGKQIATESMHRRFAISEEEVSVPGTVTYPMDRVLKNGTTQKVIVPLGSQVFKASGGANYVHGGASPQEMLIPVIDVKTQKGRVETENASIALISMTQKITNLITTLDFVQTEPVGETIKATTYKLYFVSEDNERISEEHIFNADKKDKEPGKRIFRLKFNFKNKQYDKHKKYKLVVYDMNSKVEEPVWSHDVVMDLAFANDFGF